MCLCGRDYNVRDLHLRPFLQVMNGINISITARDLHARVGTTVSITKFEGYIVCWHGLTCSVVVVQRRAGSKFAMDVLKVCCA
jgi:hypothetical protein